MKILSPALITGASGFVGSHLAETLARQKVKVKLLVRKTSRLPFKPPTNMELCHGDISDLKSIQAAVRGVKTVYHLAGLLRGSDFNSYQKVNALGTENICRAAEGNKSLKRLVYVSSLSAAGPSPKGGEINESQPCRPVSFYGQSKRMGEEIVLSYASKIPVTILRPGAVYGPRETDIFEYFKMVRLGLVVIGGDSAQRVSFIHVFDLVEAILLAGNSSKAIGNIYFVSDGQSLSWDDLVSLIGKGLKKSYFTFRVPIGIVRIVASIGDLILDITGKPLFPPIVSRDKIKEARAPGWVCSNHKICRELGFVPKISMQNGIQNTIEFYYSAGWLKPLKSEVNSKSIGFSK